MSDRSRRPIRCAIYTRKSSEEGLEQDFNSLQAQREACEAYIRSQRHEGWKLLETAYDDGGFSGGTMERPGLKRLLEDIHARRVDIVVVYKVDRLTRSLADFAKIVETFDSQNVSFVSVTQQFNTTTSMGRLTLNVLLSFAQFEREVTGERIRDKVAASKKKGMWMGGYVPLGYRAIQKRLIINEPEVKLIREIFSLYLKRKNVRLVAEDLQRRKVIRPSTTAKTGRSYGKTNFSRGLLYKMLSNPIYVGEIEHRGERFKSQHEAIIDQKTWNSVQQLLAKNSKERKFPTNAKAPNLLTGLLFDEEGRKWTTSHASKGSRRYRYYVSPASENKELKRLRIAAHDLENTVVAGLQAFLADRAKLIASFDLKEQKTKQTGVILQNAKSLGDQLVAADTVERRLLLSAVIHRIILKDNELCLEIRRDEILLRLISGSKNDQAVRKGSGRTWPIPPRQRAKANSQDNLIAIKFSACFRRTGVETRLVIDGKNQKNPSHSGPALLKMVARAVTWVDDLKNGSVSGLSQLASRENMTAGNVSRILPLAFLAPDIVEEISMGNQINERTARNLMRRDHFPPIWRHQQ